MVMDSWKTDPSAPSGRKISYPQRLFLWLLGYSLLLVGCFVVFQYRREKEFKADELNSQLQLVNAYILTELQEGKEPAGVPLREFHSFPDLRVSVIDGNDGTVVYDNSLDRMPGTSHLQREEIRKALASGSGYAVRRHSESTGETYFYSARRGNGGVVVRTAVPYSVSLSGLLKADFGFLWFMGGVTLVMCVLGYFATRRVGQNISRLSSFAESAEKGERICDTLPFPHDELGDISKHIVRLYAAQQRAVAERDREHRAALHEQREKERIKKQLTNNINHELKTPVASIQVCVETMLAHEDLPEEKRRDFLRRCLANTSRLKSLLADVSLITRMDDGGEAITMRPLDLSAVIAEVVSDCLPAAEAKGMEIVNRIGNVPEITGNPALLSSVFHNLLDNAIAYSGGSSVVIERTDMGNDRLGIMVADNGCGVAGEHLPRLFERFYRIDKGRSRAAGGTGLGLAIVKNAVLLHGGTIGVDNRPGGGLAFYITLPVS